MKTLFENRYLSNMEVLKEYVEKIVEPGCRGYKMYLGLLALLAIIIVLCNGNQSPINIALAWIVICIMFLFIYPVRYGKRIIKKSEENFKYNTEETVAWFDENEVVVSDGINRSVFRYIDIKRLIETPNLYCMMIDKSNGIILKKDSFTVGNFGTFREFAEASCDKKTIMRK